VEDHGEERIWTNNADRERDNGEGEEDDCEKVEEEGHPRGCRRSRRHRCALSRAFTRAQPHGPTSQGPPSPPTRANRFQDQKYEMQGGRNLNLEVLPYLRATILALSPQPLHSSEPSSGARL